MKKITTILVMAFVIISLQAQTSRRSTNTSSRNVENRSKSEKSMASSQRSNNENSSNRATRPTSERPNQSSNATVSSNSRSSRTVSQNTNTNSRSANDQTRRASVNVSNRTTPTVHPSSTTHRHNTNVTRHNPGRYVSSSRKYVEVHPVRYHHVHAPKSKVYREVHYAYRAPSRVRLVWSHEVHFNFARWYPEIRYTWYPSGYELATISAYRADYHIGDVANVYGKVKEVYYSNATDEYMLYIGEYYPYHDFTIVVPGYVARKYSNRPDWFFRNEHVVVSGLITEFNGVPEIVVKSNRQLNIY